jgi:hypothetical protein
LGIHCRCYQSTLYQSCFVDEEKEEEEAREKREGGRGRKSRVYHGFGWVGVSLDRRSVDRDFGIIDSILEADLIINRAADLERERKKTDPSRNRLRRLIVKRD